MDIIYIIIIIILVLLIVGLIINLALKYLNPHICDDSLMDTKSYDGIVEFHKDEEIPYLLKRNDDGTISDNPFKIMVVADMHNRTDECIFGLTVLSRFIEKEKPDLVIMLGDNFTSNSDTKFQEIIMKFFEDRKQYYGFVLGNHDSEAYISNYIRKEEEKRVVSEEEKAKLRIKGRKWAFDTMSKSKYCVTYDDMAGLIHGSGNSVVNIKDSKGIRKSLFFFDSGDYVWNAKRKAIGTEKRSYDYIHKDQLDWYKNKLEIISKLNNNKKVKSLCFFHIALPEHEIAYREAIKKNGRAKLIYGKNYEVACSSDFDDGAFKVFKESNSCELLMVGHDHKNDSLVKYEGIYMMYSQGLQYDGAYNRRKRAPLSFKLLNLIGGKYSIYNEGVSLLMVKNNEDVQISAKYASKEGHFKGLEEYYERAFFKKRSDISKSMSIPSKKLIESLDKTKLTKIDTKEYRKFKSSLTICKSYLYKYKNYGYISILETKALFGLMKLFTFVFTPSSGINMPLLLIDIMMFNKKNVAFIEYYDMTIDKVKRKELEELKNKYSYIENYKEKDGWYISKRAPYSLIKGGSNTKIKDIIKMVGEEIRAYMLYQSIDDFNDLNIKSLKEFRDDLINKGNPSSELLNKALKNKANDFYKNVIMRIEE